MGKRHNGAYLYKFNGFAYKFDGFDNKLRNLDLLKYLLSLKTDVKAS
jgi:hypothetical protein